MNDLICDTLKNKLLIWKILLKQIIYVLNQKVEKFII